MLATNHTIAGNRRDGRLVSWQNATSPQDRLLRWRWIAALLCGIVFTAFLSVISSPLDTPRIRFVIAGPLDLDNRPSVLDRPEHESHFSATQLAREAVRRVDRLARERSAQWRIDHVSLQSSSAALAATDGDDVLVVYGVGVPLIERDRVRIAWSSTADDSIDLSEWLKSLRGKNIPQLILLDWIIPTDVDAGAIPEWTRWRVSQCVRDSLATLDAPATTIVQRYTDNRSVAGNQRHPPVAGIAERLAVAMSTSADTDQDQVISISECVKSLWEDFCNDDSRLDFIEVLPARSQSVMSRTKLAKVLPAKNDPTFAAKKSMGDESEMPQATELEIEKHGSTPEPGAGLVTLASHKNAPLQLESQQPSNTFAAIPAIAPTATAALALQKLGIGTEQLESAQTLLDSLTQLCELSDGEPLSAEWIQDHRSHTKDWQLARWVNQVLDSALPWETKRVLIRTQLRYDRLAVDPTLRGRFEHEFEVARWHWLDAQRSLDVPVRQHNQQYVARRAREADELFAEIERNLEINARSQALIDTVIRGIADWLALPLHVTSHHDDPGCQLLRDTAKLMQTSGSTSDFSPTTLTELSQRIEQRLQGLAESSRRQPAICIDAQQRADIEMDGAQTRSQIQVRIARAIATIQLRTFGEDPAAGSVDELEQAARMAISAVSRFDLTHQEVGTTIANYLRLMAQQPPQPFADDALENQPAVLLTQRQALIKDLALDLIEMRRDTTASQRAELQTLYRRCRDVASFFDLPVKPWPIDDFVIEARVNGSLVDSTYATVHLNLDRAVDFSGARWEIEADPTTLQTQWIDFDGIDVGYREPNAAAYRSVAYQSLPTGLATKRSSSPRRVNAEQENKPLAASFRISRTSGLPESTAINVRLITADDVRRLSLPIELPQRPFVQLGRQPPPDGLTDSAESMWIVAPNRDSGKRLTLRSIDQPRELQIQILAMERDTKVPLGAIPVKSADDWIARSGDPPVVAQLPPTVYSDRDIAPLLFPPQEVTPEEPRRELKRLVVRIDDVVRQRVQFIPIELGVLRPAALIQPTVDCDPSRSVIEISARRLVPSQEDDPSQAIRLSYQLCRCGDRSVISSGEQYFASETMSSIGLSTSNCADEELWLTLEVNDWPSSFVYRVKPDRFERDLQPVEDATVAITQDTRFQVVGRQRATMAVDVLTAISDSAFRYGHDEVRLGIDLNGDRSLSGEPQWVATEPTSTGFFWQGVGPEAEIQIRSHVAPRRFHVPTQLLSDGRYDLIAQVRRGDQIVWSESGQLVVDSEPPKIKSVRIDSSLPAILGDAVSLVVVVDDNGLSGAGRVEAAWAIGGRVQFDHQVVVVPAQRLVDGRWSLAMPTDALVSGVHQLLVRGIDNAGNVGDPHPIEIELLTPQQLQARREAATTVVQGKIQFVNRGVEGMNVTLVPAVKEPDDGPEDSKLSTANQPAPAVHLSVMTQQDGRFVFPRVRGGEYELVAEGMYLGENRRATTGLSVQPPNPTTVPTLRID